jgi:hypothetical protein
VAEEADHPGSVVLGEDVGGELERPADDGAEHRGVAPLTGRDQVHLADGDRDALPGEPEQARAAERDRRRTRGGQGHDSLEI